MLGRGDVLDVGCRGQQSQRAQDARVAAPNDSAATACRREPRACSTRTSSTSSDRVRRWKVATCPGVLRPTLANTDQTRARRPADHDVDRLGVAQAAPRGHDAADPLAEPRLALGALGDELGVDADRGRVQHGGRAAAGGQLAHAGRDARSRLERVDREVDDLDAGRRGRSG